MRISSLKHDPILFVFNKYDSLGGSQYKSFIITNIQAN